MIDCAAIVLGVKALLNWMKSKKYYKIETFKTFLRTVEKNGETIAQ